MNDVLSESLGLIVGAFPVLMEVIINNPILIFGLVAVFLSAVFVVFRLSIRLRG